VPSGETSFVVTCSKLVVDMTDESQQLSLLMSIAVKSHTTGFPVFCITSAGNNNDFLVGGGGGATKAGVKNAVVLIWADLDIVSN
jgi:hypothetical protein